MKRARERRAAKNRTGRYAIESLETRQLFSAGYTVTDLGAFAGGTGQSFATGLNNLGQVVGYSSISSTVNHPFLYSNGVLQDINPTGGDSQAWGINDSGQIVGKAGDAFLYSNGLSQSIGRLRGGNTSIAYAINNGGQIAGDSLTSDASVTHAFLYTFGEMVDLGTFGGIQSNAFGVNNHGDVAGLAYDASGVSHAFLFTGGRLVNVGKAWTAGPSTGRAVNDNGQLVGYGYFPGRQSRHALLFSNGKLTDLQTLGGVSSAAMAINSQGQIVGDSNIASGTDHAFIYSDGQMQDLNNLISASSGWVLQRPSGINDSGQIVGTGTIDGHQHAFLLTPVQVPPSGSISGTVYNDANSSRSREQGEAGLPGWTVFVDVNGNGTPDAGEPSTVTSADGSYSIAGLAPGNYRVDETLMTGYTLTAPQGGHATVQVVANQDAAVESFGNVLTPAPPGDASAPSATIAAPDITTSAGVSQTITVVYTDNVAIDRSSIDAGDISVTGPAGPLSVTAAGVSGANQSTVIATYTVTAPGGSWDSADNGSYIVSVKAHQISDTSGNFAGGASGSFSVSVAAPQIGNGSDPSFNNGQDVGTNFVTEAVVAEPDGKVLAVGREGDLTAGTSRSVIERLNADGSLDTTFGTHGIIISAAGVNDAYYAVLLQDAGHFIVAGTRAGDFVLSRFSISGVLDPAFGSGGQTVTDFGTSGDAVRGLALTPAGLIVAGGDSGANLAFARYDATGSPDVNFAQNGRQLYGLGDGTNNGVGAVAVDSAGRVLAAGAEGANAVVVRLTAAGEADGTFGNGGLVIVPQLVARTDLGTPDRSEGLAIQPDGQILVANRAAGAHFGLVRLDADGTVDSSFGINGLVSASFGGDDDADAILLHSSGAVVVIGTSLQADGAHTAVGLFDASGAAMASFGNNGLLLLPAGSETAATLNSVASDAVIIGPRALHVGDIVLRAFGTVTPDGRVVIGTTNDAVAATTSSTLRRLIIPIAGSAAGKNLPGICWEALALLAVERNLLPLPMLMAHASPSH